jgi:Protein of unknown function (DUF1761)
MDVQVNWLAVAIAAVANLAVGSIWYSKFLFAEEWRKLVKMDAKKFKAGANQGIVIAVITAVISAYVLAYLSFAVHSVLGGSFAVDSLKTAFLLWFGVSATTIFVQAGFEQRDVKLTALNLGNSLAAFLAMGIAIGWIGL